jgi:hypothetical protein
MTTEEAARILLDRIDRNDFPSMVDLSNALGDEAKGDLMWELGAPNMIIWADMSHLFCSALESLREQIEPVPTSWLTYMADGGTLHLPLVKRASSKGYKKPHWLPVTWRRRITPLEGKNKKAKLLRGG